MRYLFLAIRECQGLMSLRNIRKPLRDVILMPTRSLTTSRSSSSNPKISLNISSPSSLKVPKPSSVPKLLWSSLVSMYDASQLQAICAVCTSDNTQDVMTLLQGPPGKNLFFYLYYIIIYIF
jgi:hypothetical protein